MIKQVINIEDYWKIIVYYNVDYNLFDYILKDFHKVRANNDLVIRIYYTMYNKKAKAVTVSNKYLNRSVVLFNKHKDYRDYLNSITHEAEHIKQSMLAAYNVNDEGEPPAYTIGYIVMKMLTPNIIKLIGINNS